MPETSRLWALSLESHVHSDQVTVWMHTMQKHRESSLCWGCEATPVNGATADCAGRNPWLRCAARGSEAWTGPDRVLMWRRLLSLLSPRQLTYWGPSLRYVKQQRFKASPPPPPSLRCETKQRNKEIKLKFGKEWVKRREKVSSVVNAYGPGQAVCAGIRWVLRNGKRKESWKRRSEVEGGYYALVCPEWYFLFSLSWSKSPPPPPSIERQAWTCPAKVKLCPPRACTRLSLPPAATALVYVCFISLLLPPQGIASAALPLLQVSGDSVSELK